MIAFLNVLDQKNVLLGKFSCYFGIAFSTSPGRQVWVCYQGLPGWTMVFSALDSLRMLSRLLEDLLQPQPTGRVWECVRAQTAREFPQESIFLVQNVQNRVPWRSASKSHGIVADLHTSTNSRTGFRMQPTCSVVQGLLTSDNILLSLLEGIFVISPDRP